MSIMPVDNGNDDPVCPHCGKDLDGWTAPCNIPITDKVIAVIILVFIAMQVGGFAIGLMESNRLCDPWFSTTADVAVPTKVLGCEIGRFLQKPFNGG